MPPLYQERVTWLHAVSVWIKLLFVAVAGTGLFLTEAPALLIACAAASALVFLSLGLPVPGVRRLIRSIALGALLVAGFHVCTGSALLGLTSASRLLAMACLGMSLSLTTSHVELLDVFETWLSPLARLGVRVDRLSLQMVLMMRFVAQFFQQWQRLDDAHRLRTGRPGGWRLLFPLTLQMLLAARRVADSLQLRLGP